MTESYWFLVRCLVWVPTTSVCLICSMKGFTSTPRFDTWFWGIALVIDLIAVGFALKGVVS